MSPLSIDIIVVTDPTQIQGSSVTYQHPQKLNVGIGIFGEHNWNVF